MRASLVLNCQLTLFCPAFLSVFQALSSTMGDLAKKYEISPEMISRWKKELVENASVAFGAKAGAGDFDKERDALHRKIGELEMDVDFCKRVYKQLGIPIPEKH